MVSRQRGNHLTYWHVETDYVALALLIIMVIKNRQLTSDKSRRHQTFYWVLVISIFSVIVDILSSTAMNSASSWWFYEIMMVLYVLTMPINAVFWMGYSAVLVTDEKDYGQVKKLVHVALIPYYVYCIMALSNPVTEVFFHLTKDMVYSRGVLFIPGGFGFIILYTLAGIVILIRGRKKFDNPANAWMLAAVFAFTLAAIGIQVLNPGWLIACSSYALLYVFCDMTVEEERRNVLYKTIEHQNAALKESVEKANAASLAKSNFLANMSHDIRTPLNAITGMTSMAIANIDDKKHVLEDLQIVQASSKHLLNLVNDVLDLSKIESGKMTISRENFIFPDLLTDVETMCITMFHAKQQTFQVTAPTVDHEFLIGDMPHLKQVLVNLLSNANKYTPYGGTIHLDVAEEPGADPDKTTLRFTVSDNGIGISPDKMEEIFEPFNREINTTVNQVEGTGLGLTIVKSIVNAMGGTIDVVSEKGKGSVFTATIPLGVPGREVEANQFADIRNDKILLIVDAAEKKEKKRQAFTDAGIACKVICQDEIKDTVRAENKDYSAILVTNENQPLEIIREIRQESLTDDILFACSINQVEKVDAAISAGADSILFQPVFKTTLFEELQRIRRKKSSPESDRKYLNGRNILVAEDQPINYMIIEYMLKEAGASVEHAENGKAAVEMFSSSKPGRYDLILMDIMMPVMGGYEATSAIRHMDRPDAGSIPIIAMTANAFSEDIQKSRDMGMNSHISKPIDAAVVKKVLTTVLADGSRFSA